ncbi:uncharacterized protein LOC121377816 [Gigantopelta aegis]|uniref:uncharacterized protein LOC121377816 n=1 Tax=Gigantopelta aegis TaxID=1735272 RepID=UPI001B88DC55|nr:uncharacterized protein LOC121377816 [Gigantopelta aegis]
MILTSVDVINETPVNGQVSGLFSQFVLRPNMTFPKHMRAFNLRYTYDTNVCKRKHETPVNGQGLSMTITTSAVTARRNQDVTVTCTIQDAEGLQSTVYIYLGTFYFRAAYFYQRATGCEPRSTDDRVPISLTTVCGSGTNSSESSSKEYILTTRPRKVLTNYYRGTSFRGSTYFSNAVTFSLLSEVDCASINISGGGDVLTVTQGTEFDGITCSTGGANPEPEVKLKLKLDETSSADLPARKLASARTMEFERTLCNPLEFETYSSRTTARLAFVPDRHHDGKYVYCSAKNSEMGINDEVTSNEIRLIVQCK